MRTIKSKWLWTVLAAQALAVAMLWILSACTEHKPVLAPHARINPDPSERYEISLTLLEDPGDITHVTGAMNYTIANRDCLPTDYTMALGGMKPKFREEKIIPISSLGETYTATVYEDFFLSEDYYGLGVCNWKVEGIGISLHRGSVTNVVVVPTGYERIIEVESKRQRCAYEGNRASSDGRDSCLLESAPFPRKFFTTDTRIKRVK